MAISSSREISESVLETSEKNAALATEASNEYQDAVTQLAIDDFLAQLEQTASMQTVERAEAWTM